MKPLSATSFATQLDLRPDISSTLLQILARSAALINDLRPDWYRARMDGRRHLRLFLGRTIVITLRGDYVWLATDPAVQPVEFSQLVSWRCDDVAQRPTDAKGIIYPKYSRPPSLNGFYIPALDRNGTEWTSIATSHYSYLSRLAVSGRAPDHRTIHDLALAAEIKTWITSVSPEETFQKAVRQAMSADADSRRRRLAEAPRRPVARTVEVRVFDRNPDVVAEVLARAAGNCEHCRSFAPFRRASDGTPYLEVHHLVHLANGGDDTVENAVALCPNCHRQKHYG